MKPLLLMVVAAAGLISGCAHMPEVTYHYYPTTWKSTVTVTQAVDCDAKQEHIYTSEVPKLETEYSADTGQEPAEFDTSKLTRSSADTDFTMYFTDDGRLKSINASTEGHGDSVVKGAISFAVAAFQMTKASGEMFVQKLPVDAKLDLLTDDQKKDIGQAVKTACTTIKDLGHGKPLALTYAVTLDPETVDDALNSPTRALVPIDAAADDKNIVQRIDQPNSHKDIHTLPKLYVEVENLKDEKSGVAFGGASDSTIRLQKTHTLKLSFRVYQSGTADTDEDTFFGDSKVVVPECASFDEAAAGQKAVNEHKAAGIMDPEQFDCFYSLPVPKAAFIGKQTFSLALADSGRIVTAGYGATSGAAGALDALNAAAQSQSPANKAAELKAEGDVIAQRKRLVSCKAGKEC